MQLNKLYWTYYLRILIIYFLKHDGRYIGCEFSRNAKGDFEYVTSDIWSRIDHITETNIKISNKEIDRAKRNLIITIFTTMIEYL